MKKEKKKLSAEQRDELLSVLKTRFEKNMKRHKGIEWSKVQAKLEASPEKMWSLSLRVLISIFRTFFKSSFVSIFLVISDQ